ncbi:ATP-binding response regulator [Chitinophaga lutea]
MTMSYLSTHACDADDALRPCEYGGIRTSHINLLAVVTSIIAWACAAVSFFSNGEALILCPAVTEGCIFAAIPLVTAIGWVKPAVWSMFVTHCMSALYFGVLLGPVANVQSLTIFLLGSVFILFKNRNERIFGVSLTLLILGALEICYQYELFTPLHLPSFKEGMLRWLILFSVVALNCTVLYIYIRENLRYSNKLESLVRERTRKLEQATHSMGIFVSRVTHEIRSPLNIISGIVQNYADQPHLPNGHVKVEDSHLMAMNGCCQDVVGIINDVLDWSRIEAGQFEQVAENSFDLVSWANLQIAKYRHLGQMKRINLHLQMGANIPAQVISDQKKLSRILGNLLSNAIKFSFPCSVISVKLTIDGGLLEISVADQGAGIPADKLESIFSPYMSESNDLINGTGLGLPITRHITQLLGGSIRVESEPGYGSLFTVRVPITAALLPQPQPHDTTIPAVIKPFEGINVLVVDDNNLNQMAAGLHLKRLKMNALFASTAAEAMKIAQDQKPDLILSDLQMPHVNGMQLLSALRQNDETRHIPFIAVSGISYIEAQHEVMQSGADGFITKPIIFATLYQELEQVLRSAKVAQIAS